MSIDVTVLQPAEASAFLLGHAGGITILSVSACLDGRLIIRHAPLCAPVAPPGPAAIQAAAESPVDPERQDGPRESRDGLVRRLYGPDLGSDFAATVGALSPVGESDAHFPGVLRQRMSQRLLTFVSTSGGRVNGTSSLIIEPKFSYGGRPVGHLEDVSVHPSWHGRGVGSLVVRHAMQEAWAAGCRKVILACNRELIPFYQRFGFAEHGVYMRIDSR